MAERHTDVAPQIPLADGHGDGDLDDLLQELRVLLNGAQVLTAFLVVLPFSEGFHKIQHAEKWAYVATFVFSVSGLIMFSAPAAQHRLERPLRDRARFKNMATRMILVGMAFFSLALVLATHLVVAEAIGNWQGIAVAVIIAVLIGAVWWVLPLSRRTGSDALGYDRENRDVGGVK